MEFIKKAEKEPVKESRIYRTDSIYKDPEVSRKFLLLKANVCDINPALIKKCITGTEQDFILLMEKARDYVRINFPEEEEKLLLMFRECVFGYYALTPLVRAHEVSDIRVFSYDRITVKANGKRYVAEVSFYDRRDYEQWYERQLLIQRLGHREGLMHCTDRNGADEFYLRNDFQLPLVTSDGGQVLHIRKTPNQKHSWEYLVKNRMLDHSMIAYIKDRILAGYGFLISGKGGSGKSTLLNSMIDEIPFDESVLVVQESDELYSSVHPQILFEHTVEGSDTKKGYGLEEELRMGLLQDIDTFVIGEIKGGEALYVFTTALSTGARFFGTIHANDARTSVRRLAHCARYISDYPVETLEEMLSALPFVLIHMDNFSIDEILEADGFDEAGKRLKFQTIYKKEAAKLWHTEQGQRC
ncbi:MAG: Flp pilus assembly complex ATPase component TadA [Lachnospiraceae bacterium]|nr:Flp pilus assembly complex ATPase component TadA [Lachnospiraceae bacterium]